MYIVKPNRRYTILEKPDSLTPPELRAIGKAKMGGNTFAELAGCPWDDVANRYETGLNKHSREFHGVSPEAVAKTLEDRKELISYLNDIVSASGLSETEFLADYVLELTHNKIVDTSILDNYLRLFLAMRGTLITPETERGNIAKYSNSMFMLRDTKETFNAEVEMKEKKLKVKEWFFSKDIDTIHEVLRYEGIIDIKQTKPKAIISDILDRKIEDIQVLDNLLFTIEKTSNEEIVTTNSVSARVREGVIKKEDGYLVFQGAKLGKDLKSAVKFLLDATNIDISSKLIK